MDGRREVEAAKLRLAAAKRQASLAAQLMEAATKEVNDAELFLKQTEERLEVIDVDASPLKSGDGGRDSKKRKISMSPAHDTEHHDSGATASAAAPAPSESTDRSDTSSATRQPTGNDSDATDSTSNGAQDARQQVIEKRRKDFQLIADNHRLDTLELMRKAARERKTIVSALTMSDARVNNEGKMWDIAMLLVNAGGGATSAEAVRGYLDKAEEEAVQLHARELPDWSKPVQLEMTYLSWREKCDDIASGARRVPRSLAIRAAIDNTGGRSIVISGCGVPGANGTYTEQSGVLSDSVPVYSKDGRFKGASGTFTVYRRKTGAFASWIVAVSIAGGPSQILYKTKGKKNDARNEPPARGWTATGQGAKPAPTIKL